MIAIGEAARLSGIGIETIRYYEREGIVPRPERAANNRRQYSKDDIGRLLFLKKCRDLGFSLSDAKTLLGLSERRESDCHAVSRIAEIHMASVRQKIAALTRLEAALNEISANCAKGNVDCPMLVKLREG